MLKNYSHGRKKDDPEFRANNAARAKRYVVLDFKGVFILTIHLEIENVRLRIRRRRWR
jgi:hypothetical protein